MSEAPTKPLDLFSYSEEELLVEKKLTHYEILELSPFYSDTNAVKKAYRRKSVQVHPDKTGRDDDDYVFLAVKAAYETLMDPVKRQAYDSTVLPFDDAIPPSYATLRNDPMLMYSDDDFYETFGPVFERNYRFDARLRPELAKKNLPNNKRTNKAKVQPPVLGTHDTPVEQVRQFYQYWVHIESWRDFSAQAADELQVENELENAESRFEKRWIQKEIDKRAKQLKKQEMGRIQTLVERAMEADPRLRKERRDAAEKKDQAKREREEQAQRQRELQEEQRRAEEEAEQLEKQRKAEEKVQKEKEKKELRKARQSLRKMASASFDRSSTSTDLWDDAYEMNQDVEALCSSLSLNAIADLTEKIDKESDPQFALGLIKTMVVEAKRAVQNEGATAAEEPRGPRKTVAKEDSNATKNPWTKDELSALAKAVKKFPPGGAQRWEQITLFVNNLCKQAIPRSKEECIEKYNQLARSNVAVEAKNESVEPRSTESSASDAWSAEQDQQLQDGLAQFPATMDKNERWTKIAKGVTGKTKKDCVQRFKAIREALQGRK